ncbi:MAG: hypothetical protein ACRDON_08980 [Gaiellaceae bacterium]
MLSGHRATAEDRRFVSHEIDLARREYFFEAYRRGPGGDPRCPPRLLAAFPDARPVKPRSPA